jgi:plasmid stabilization system protein ParE
MLVNLDTPHGFCKAEAEKLKKQLRKINASLRQQTRAGVCDAGITTWMLGFPLHFLLHWLSCRRFGTPFCHFKRAHHSVLVILKSVRQGKAEAEKLNERLRKINASLRQQTRAGAVC